MLARAFRRVMVASIVAASAAAWSGSSAAAEDPLAGLDAAIEAARTQWKVPGLAVAIVKDDKVVFAKGYGVRQLDRNAAVDTHTLFTLASTTKAFVATAIGILVDEGKLRWDDPVIRYVPEFRVADAYVTREVTVRDLLVHRTGIEEMDVLWSRGFDTATSLRQMQNAAQATSLRSTWAYNNMMYVVAAEVVARVSGKKFEDFVAERIFTPLGMNDSTFTGPALAQRDNVVGAHLIERGVARQIAPYRSEAPLGAAGVQSSVADMAHWLRMLLNGGSFNGATIVKPETVAETLKPQMLLARVGYPAAVQAKPHFYAYGLGWFLQDYQGRMLAMHTGSLYGANALAALVPEEKLGLVILVNASPMEYRHAFMYDVIDRFIGSRDKDWNADLQKLFAKLQAEEGEQRAKAIDGRAAVDISDTAEGDLNQLYRGRVSFPLVHDKLALSLSGFYQDSDGFIDEAVRPVENVNSSELRGGQATLLYQPIEPLKIKLNYTDQEFEFANTNAVPFNRTTGQPIFGRYKKRTATDTPTSINFKLYSGTVEYQADWATATLASSRQEFAQNAILDLSAAFGPFADNRLGVPVGTNTVLLDFDISTEREVHELRLTSPNNEHVEWLAGLYYTKEESSNFQATDVRPGPLDIITQQFPSDYKEFAAFGNVTYYFTPQLDATLGMRYSSNDMSVVFTGTGVLAGPNLPRTTVSDEVQTYLFNVRYRPSDDVSLYLRIADGYRPASANLGLIDPATGAVLSVPFVEADSLWSYEVGAKGNLAGGLLAYDIAVYHLKWENLQVFRSFLGANVGGNADSDVSANGVEATFTLQPTTAFNLVGTLGYSTSELDEDDPSIGGLEGEQLPGIPEWSFSLSGNYRFPLGALEGFVGGGVTYQDQRKTSFKGGRTASGVVIGPANPNYTVDDYMTADLRAGVTAGRYQFSVYATNLFNEYAFQRATTSSVQGTATILRPRTIGAVVSVDF